MHKIQEVMIQGLWKNNSVLVKLLGLCPILSVTITVSNAIGFGLITTVILILTNFLISLLRRWIPYEIRIPIYTVTIVSVVSIVKMLTNAFLFDVYQPLETLFPLVVINCIFLERTEIFAAKNYPLIAVLDGFSVGIGATFSMFTLSVIRELFGNGTLFTGIGVFLGNWAKTLCMKILHTNSVFILARLPSGAFIILGILVAIKYCVDSKSK